jgi:hypothetical protein
MPWPVPKVLSRHLRFKGSWLIDSAQEEPPKRWGHAMLEAPQPRRNAAMMMTMMNEVKCKHLGTCLCACGGCR